MVMRTPNKPDRSASENDVGMAGVDAGQLNGVLRDPVMGGQQGRPRDQQQLHWKPS